ncbi:MAG: hypothetical protein DHS20C15_23310 [Planctomycetota bacterium]|nr:MAG: hypothetical protein DHS20C15_23310 [Planctomycetota bacterium]
MIALLIAALVVTAWEFDEPAQAPPIPVRAVPVEAVAVEAAASDAPSEHAREPEVLHFPDAHTGPSPAQSQVVLDPYVLDVYVFRETDGTPVRGVDVYAYGHGAGQLHPGCGERAAGTTIRCRTKSVRRVTDEHGLARFAGSWRPRLEAIVVDRSDDTAWRLLPMTPITHDDDFVRHPHEIVLHVPPGGTLSGRMIGVDGRGVPGALVLTTRLPFELGTERSQPLASFTGRAVPTDANGHYELKGVGPDVELAARANAPDMAVLQRFVGRLESPNAHAELDFLAVRAAPLRAELVTLSDRPVPGVELRAKADARASETFELAHARGFEDLGPWIHAVSGADGSLLIDAPGFPMKIEAFRDNIPLFVRGAEGRTRFFAKHDPAAGPLRLTVVN